MSVLIDGTDLKTLGLRVNDLPEIRDGLSTDYAIAKVPGRIGAVQLGIAFQDLQRHIDAAAGTSRLGPLTLKAQNRASRRESSAVAVCSS